MSQCVSHKFTDIGHMLYDIYRNYNIEPLIWIDLRACFSENIYAVRLSNQ